MGQNDLVPFSSLIAGLLLIKRSVDFVEVVNVLSRITESGIIIDDENDDIDCLFPCMALGTKCCFYLKDNLSYETMLFPNVSVREFLMDHTNEGILSFLANDVTYKDCYWEQFPNLSETSSNSYLTGAIQKKCLVEGSKKRVRKKSYKRIPYCILFGEFL